MAGDPGRFVGPPLHESFGEILGSDDSAYIEQAIALYRERFATTGIFENAVYPGIPDALREMQDAGYCLAVVTSKPQVFADRVLDHFELASYFHGVYGPSLDGHPATKSELLAEVMFKEGASLASACMIGDRLYDMEAAKVNNITAVGVQWGYGTKHELISSGADVLVESVEHLVSSIKGLAGVRSDRAG